MKTELKVKFLQFLLGKKKNLNEGFTLIELLVVVIIIGVLAAVALPNLLGQVGKARESEAKNVVGALNRAQQARFTERGAFTADIKELEVPVGNEDYYTITVPAAAVQLAAGKGNADNGTRDYVGGVQYDQTTRAFNTVICRASNAATPTYNVTAANITNQGVLTASAVLGCTGNAEEIK